MTRMMEQAQGYRVSEQQKGLWRRREAVALGWVEVEGRLEVGELKRVVERVVAGQEILRTRLVGVEGSRVPVQVVEERGEVGWRVEDARGRSGEEKGKWVEQVWEEEQSQGFDLEQGPV